METETDNDRKDAERAIEPSTGRTQPAIGPSDSSDSLSELPRNQRDSDSDRQHTGDRATVENVVDESAGDDVAPDKIVPDRNAGLAHTAPDPVRNGGRSGAKTKD